MTDPNRTPPATPPVAKTAKPATRTMAASEFEYQRSKADERTKFLNERQAKIDAAAKEGGADGDERGTVKSQYDNPPSVRATDGGEPGTKERHPLEVAAELETSDPEQEAE